MRPSGSLWRRVGILQLSDPATDGAVSPGGLKKCVGSFEAGIHIVDRHRECRKMKIRLTNRNGELRIVGIPGRHALPGGDRLDKGVLWGCPLRIASVQTRSGDRFP